MLELFQAQFRQSQVFQRAASGVIICIIDNRSKMDDRFIRGHWNSSLSAKREGQGGTHRDVFSDVTVLHTERPLARCGRKLIDIHVERITKDLIIGIRPARVISPAIAEPPFPAPMMQISLKLISFFPAFMMVTSTQPETPPFDETRCQ